MIMKRTTVYLSDDLVKMLKLRSIKTNQSVSEYISEVVSQDLLEEQGDLADIQKILKESSMPLEEVLKKLKIKDEV